MEARGKYDFISTEEEELSFKKGDILKVRTAQHLTLWFHMKNLVFYRKQLDPYKDT